jgi:F-type H+-transporting ATPase subunit a
VGSSYQPDAPYAIRQFALERVVALQVGGIDLSLTNLSLAMLTTALLIAASLVVALRRRAMVPGRAQAAVEFVYDFVRTNVFRTAGPDAGAHVPFVFTMFVMIFFGTLLGLTPLKFTFTSHLVITFGLALIVFGYVVLLGLWLHGMGFFRMFLPPQTPPWLYPLIVLVEVISFLFRPVTLGVRLFVNVLAGHMIIKLFADFCVMIVEAAGPAGVLGTIAPIAMMVVFYAFEIVIFFLQSYIFMLLTCVYIRSSIEAH